MKLLQITPALLSGILLGLWLHAIRMAPSDAVVFKRYDEAMGIEKTTSTRLQKLTDAQNDRIWKAYHEINKLLQRNLKLEKKIIEMELAK